jgi:HlyD family secretion protein
MSTSDIQGSTKESQRQKGMRDAPEGTGRTAGPTNRREPEQPAPAPKPKPPAATPPRQASGQGSGFWKRSLYVVLAIAVAVGAFFAWKIFSMPDLPPGFAGGNGRLEANLIYVATKYPGRIQDVLFNEGDTVEAGQVVARMDTSALDAQLRQALADITAAEDNRRAALAQVQVKEADYNYAQKQYVRSRDLVTQGAVSEQEAEIDAARMQATRAELVRSQAEATRSVSSINAAKATADRLRAEIKDAVLVSPIRARIETRLSEPGEVLPQGGRVFSLNDLSDVYMYVYLPESVTGKVALGSEARIVLDAAPQYPIRTYVSFVSPVAQFTPKTVETEEERHNLTFRVKLQIDKDRLRDFEGVVKSGLPGMGYVRWDAKEPWPDRLQVKPIPTNLWQQTGASGAK